MSRGTENSDCRLPPVAVMFSGGRDSSLAAVGYCLQGYPVRLLRFSTGLGLPSKLPELREAEIRERFAPTLLPTPPPIPVFGLVRRIAIADIEDDFRRFGGKNLVLLGEKLAIHAAALVFCLVGGIDLLADGTSGYQTEMPEQRACAVDYFRHLSLRFGVAYETPIVGYLSADDVKYALLDAGISTKSLEGLSMFADSFSVAADQTVLDYLVSKERLVTQYINTFTQAVVPRTC